jgi:hypothetical protein
LTTGKGNTCLGTYAGYSLTTGVSNTFVGFENTGEFGAGHLVTTGSRNTFIGGYNGNEGGLDLRTSDNNIVLSDGDGNVPFFTNSESISTIFSRTANKNTLHILSATSSGTVYNLIRAFSNSTNVAGGSATVKFLVQTNGNVQNVNNSYAGISDQKLKENIEDAGSQWEDLKALRVRKFSFKEDNLDAPNMLGVVAQEVESAGMSGLISTSPDQDTEGNTLETETKSVKYSVLYMKAVKALQEAMTRIETLEAKVSALES